MQDKATYQQIYNPRGKRLQTLESVLQISY